MTTPTNPDALTTARDKVGEDFPAVGLLVAQALAAMA